MDDITRIAVSLQGIVVGCSDIAPGRIMEYEYAVLGGAGICREKVSIAGIIPGENRRPSSQCCVPRPALTYGCHEHAR